MMSFIVFHANLEVQRLLLSNFVTCLLMTMLGLGRARPMEKESEACVKEAPHCAWRARIDMEDN